MTPMIKDWLHLKPPLAGEDGPLMGQIYPQGS
jgi:hypothetical protein